MHNKKFILHAVVPLFGGRIAYIIKAMKDIPRHGVKAGDIGGIVWSLAALSEDGDCWIEHGSLVIDGATVKGDAIVRGESLLQGCGCRVGGGVVIDGKRLSGTFF
jgi:hypothetical protein